MALSLSTSSSLQSNNSSLNSPVVQRKRLQPPVADDPNGHLAYIPGDILVRKLSFDGKNYSYSCFTS